MQLSAILLLHCTCSYTHWAKKVKRIPLCTFSDRSKHLQFTSFEYTLHNPTSWNPISNTLRDIDMQELRILLLQHVSQCTRSIATQDPYLYLLHCI